MKRCTVDLGERINPNQANRTESNNKENMINSQSTSSVMNDTCIGCKRSFQRIRRHLASSPSCKEHYNMQELKKKSNECKRLFMQKQRLAKRDQDEPALKGKWADEKRSQREAERDQDESALKGK